MNFMDNYLLKKYFNNNLRVLAKIQKLSEQNGHALFQEIEVYLNRSKNHISNVLSKLENDNIIRREKKKRPQKIYLTEIGQELLNVILNKLR